MNAKKRHVAQHENILVCYKKQPYYQPQKYKLPDSFKLKSNAKKSSNSRSKAFKISGEASKDYEWKDNGTRYPDTVLEFEMDSVLPIKSAFKKGMHPTQKPVDLFAYLIRTFTKQGELVLDNCIGSGTTAIACLIEKRDFIGFETEQNYHCMALQRIERLQLN